MGTYVVNHWVQHELRTVFVGFSDCADAHVEVALATLRLKEGDAVAR